MGMVIGIVVAGTSICTVDAVVVAMLRLGLHVFLRGEVRHGNIILYIDWSDIDPALEETFGLL